MKTEYDQIKQQIRKPKTINKHVLAIGTGHHIEGGSQSVQTPHLCHLIMDSTHYYQGRWESSIYHGLFFKKSEFKIIKDNLTRKEIKDFIKKNPESYYWLHGSGDSF